MAIATQPPVLSMAWASNSAADKNDIPVTMQVADMSNDGAASWSMGFPSQTSLSQGQGGYYVARQDINGALNTLSQFALFAQSGAVYNWSASVDYATGAHVRGSDGVEYIAVANSGPDVSSAVNPTTDVNYTTWKPYLRSIADFIYPVGSIYMSVNNTSPAVLFGGTWAKISGQFLLGAGSGYNAGDTGGASTMTLGVGNMPSHTHTVTASNYSHTHTVTVAAKNITATTGGQSATHKHTVTFPETTFSKAAASAGNHTHARGTLNITGTFDADDLNNDNTKPTVTGAFGYTKSTTRRDAQNGSEHGYAITFNAKNGWEGSLQENGNHTHNVTIPAKTLTCGNTSVDHTHSVTVAVPAQTITSTSNTHTHTMTVGSAGGGAAFSIMPPYLVVNVWKRTA